MTPDERHADIVRRYPDGLTPQQFRDETLASMILAKELYLPASINQRLRVLRLKDQADHAILTLSDH